jgi:tripartite-type tricarboxylate transporter receptor subunit TctC
MVMKNKFVAALTALAFTAAVPAAAQDWPTRTVRIIVPFGAGSTPDVVARLLADNMQKKLGQTFVVENKAGGGGIIGTDAVAKAAPDGATIGISIGGPLAINTLLMSKLPYDPAKDIAAVTQLITQPSGIAVNAELNVNTIAELIALLKKNPGKYNFASIGNGSLSHLAMAALAQKSGTEIAHIPYASSPQAMTAVIRGDAHMAAMPAISVKPHVESGKVKMLAVSTAKRSPYLPNVPTLKESGIDVEADAWMGLIAPGGTPPAIVEKINKAVVAALMDPAIKAKLAAVLMEPVGNSPQEFRAKINAEIGRWSPVIKAAGIKPIN